MKCKRMAQQEVEICKKLCLHPSLVQFLGGCCLNSNEEWIVMEFAPLGALSTRLGELSTKQKKDVALQVCEAMQVGYLYITLTHCADVGFSS